jgi:hypothetical protein
MQQSYCITGPQISIRGSDVKYPSLIPSTGSQKYNCTTYNSLLMLESQDIKTPNLCYTEPSTTIEELLYNITLGDEPLNINNAMGVFIKSKATEDVPYIELTLSGKVYRRVLKGWVLPSTYKQTIKVDTLYLIVAKPDIKRSTRVVSYYHVLIELTDKENIVSTAIPDVSVVPLIQQALDVTLHQTGVKLNNIESDIFIQNGDFFIDMMILSDLILNLETYFGDKAARFSPFYFEEKSDKSIYFQSHFTVRYQLVSLDEKESPNIIRDDYIQKLGRKNTVVINFANKICTNDMHRRTGLPLGNQYVEVKIQHLRNEQMSKDMLQLVIELLTSYEIFRQQYIKENIKFLSDFDLIKITKESMQEKTKGGVKSKYEANILTKRFSHIFGNNFTRTCDGKKGLTYISLEDVLNIEPGVKACPFPRDEPVGYFVCKNPEYPHLVLIKNRQGMGLPFVPCCAKGDDNSYNSYLRGSQQQLTLFSTSSNEAISDIPVGYTLLGKLPRLIETFLTSIIPNKFNRYGVTNKTTEVSPNLIINAILIATNNQGYSSASDKDQYAREVRRLIATDKNINIGVYKQEMYDMTDDEIRRYLLSDEFLDPARVYRGLEEYFNINLFCFYGGADVDANIQVPRSRIIHIPTTRMDRPTVLVYNNYGRPADQNLLDFPITELIVMFPAADVKTIKNREAVAVYDSLIASDCNKLISNICYQYVWNFDNVNRILTQYDNLFSTINYVQLFRGLLIPASANFDLKSLDYNGDWHQYIDEYGKMRALIMKTSINNEYITVVLPPSAPENIPEIKEANIPLISYNTLKQLDGIFSNINEYTIDTSGNIIAVWYQIFQTLTYGLCVPIKPTPRSQFPADIKITTKLIPLRIGINQDKSIGRISYMKRLLDIILQLIDYVFMWSPLTPDQFANKYFTIDQEIKEVDTAKIYNIKNIPYKLPTFPSDSDYSAQAINMLIPYAPTLFTTVDNQPKIRLYNSQFARKILYHLRQKYIENNALRISKIGIGGESIILKRFYDHPDDFPPVENNIILIGEDSFDNWRDKSSKTDVLNEILSISVKTKITTAEIKSSEPYLYMDKYKQIFLIQNVNGKSGDEAFRKAIALGLKWNEQRINYGDDIKQYSITKKGNIESLLPQHVMYELDESSGDEKETLYIYKDNRGEQRKLFLRIIRYNRDGNQYAAMLKL